jgi:hypothetical protein
VDWGYTNEYAIVVSAILPNDTLLVVDTFAAPGQELDDCVRIATEIKERWNIQTFYCDPAYPAYVKTFNRKGLRAPKFTKDVARGIEAVRGRIVDSTGIRRMVIVDTPNNSRLIEGFQTYHWKLNAKGEPTDTADHTEESDIMDATRYLCENLFGKKDTKASIIYAGDTINPKDPKPLQNKINELATDNQKLSKNTNGPRIVW